MRRTDDTPKRLLSVVAALSLAACLGGCGVRGSLDAPGGGAATPTATAEADSGQGKPEGAAPKPHQSFILDGLLR